MPRRRTSSREGPFDLALKGTLIWLILAIALVVGSVYRGPLGVATAFFSVLSNYIYAGFALMSLFTAFAWWWAIKTTRSRNAAGKTLDQLQALSPEDFEKWVAVRFRDMGYSTKVTGARGAGGDHGVDVVAEKPGEKAVIQCKNWKAWSVGEPKVRDLYGAMTDFGASRAYLVTTGSVTEPARRWIHGKPIEIWDGEYLARLSKQMVSKDAGSRGNVVTIEAPISDLPEPLSTSTASPVQAAINCPRCNSALVERKNKRTGELFLGCSKYPACRHTQPLVS